MLKNLRCRFCPGPVGLPENIKIIADRKVQDENAAVGANEDGFHYTGATQGVISATEYVDIREVKEGEPSPDGHGVPQLCPWYRDWSSSNSVHRYSDSMNANILDENGRSMPIIMGCYGIGVSRPCQRFLNNTLASLLIRHLKANTVTLWGSISKNWHRLMCI